MLQRVRLIGLPSWVGSIGFAFAFAITYFSEAGLLAISACSLALAALFAERRRNEAALKDSNERLQLALDGATLGVWSVDAKTGRFENDARDRRIHGHHPDLPPKTLAEARTFIHPNDLPTLDTEFAASARAGGNYSAEYRLAPASGHGHGGQQRWVAVAGTVVRDASGAPVRVLGVTRDVTHRKLADQALSVRNAELAIAGKIALLGCFAYDVGSGKMQVSPGYAAIHDLPEGAIETNHTDWRTRIHPDDLARLEASLQRDMDARRSEHYCEYRIVRPDGEIRWIEARSFISYDRGGAAQRMVGANIDVTDRKKAELALAERTLQLALAERAALVGSIAYDVDDADKMQISEGYAAIHGFPEGTTEIKRSEWQTGVHPEDLLRLEELRGRVFRERTDEYIADYRIVRPGGDVRWIEARSFVSYRSDASPQRVVGVNIDVTQRVQAEAVLKESTVRLADALAAGEVIAFEWDAVTRQSRRSDNAALILGYEAAGAVSSGRGDFLRCVHPDDRAHFKTRIRELCPQTPSYALIFRFCCPDGRQVWLEETGKAEFDPTGRLLRIKGLTRNITERKQIEDRLQRSERESRELLGALPAAVYVTDATGRFTYCNQAAIDQLGAKPKLGEDKWCDHSRFYHTDGTPMAVEDCPTEIALKRGKIIRGREAIMERADGTRITIVPYPTPLRDRAGVISGVVNMTLDVSELRKAERALAERNLQLSLAAKAALVGSYAYDTDTEVARISSGYAAIHGYPEGTTEITRSTWLSGVHPEDVKLLEELRDQAFREQSDEYSFDYRIIRSGDEVRWIETRCFISYRSNGQPQRMIGVNIDVTERKRAEEHQRVLVAELDHRVKNVLATVSAVAAHTLDASSSMAHFVAALDGRLRSMAATHELLSHRQWWGIPLAELIRRELAAYATSGNAEIDGPEVILSAEAGQAMAMVLHELVTNAAKHGALSTKSGRVLVRWFRKLNGSDRFVLVWREIGGPRVKTPKKSGYGTGVVRELIPYEFGGTVDYSFVREGVRCRLEIPFDRVSRDTRHRSGSELPHQTALAG